MADKKNKYVKLNGVSTKLCLRCEAPMPLFSMSWNRNTREYEEDTLCTNCVIAARRAEPKKARMEQAKEAARYEKALRELSKRKP